MAEAEATELRLLGRWELSVNGRSACVGTRQQRLIAALAIYGRRSRNALSGLLWPDCTEEHAMGSLRAAVFTVSRRLPGLLTIHGHDLALQDVVDVDLHHLRATLMNACSAPLDASRWPPHPPGADLLPGWYDEWVVEEQEHLRHRYVDVAERLAETALARQDHFHARHFARIVVGLEPLRESAVRILVKTHLATGNRGAAVQAFQRYANLLAAELKARPSRQLLTLMERLPC